MELEHLLGAELVVALPAQASVLVALGLGVELGLETVLPDELVQV